MWLICLINFKCFIQISYSSGLPDLVPIHSIGWQEWKVARMEMGFLSTHLLCIPQYLSQNFHLLACAQNPSKRTEIIYQYFLSPALLPAHNSLSANFC